MPEGPEVKLMVENIKIKRDEKLNNIVFTKRSTRFNENNLDLFSQLKKTFSNKIKKFFTKGKEIFLRLDGYIIIINLGFGRIEKFPDKYTLVEFHTNKQTFYLNDTRKFSSFEIVKEEELNKHINHLGYDPLYHKLTFQEVYDVYIQKFKSRQPIMDKLLDQRIFAGCGNYIRAEVIYDSRISPFCKYNELTKDMWKKIYKSYNKIVLGSYNAQKNEVFNNFKFNIFRRRDRKDIKYIKC